MTSKTVSCISILFFLLRHIESLEVKLFSFVSQFHTMQSCWELQPLDRPSFEELCHELTQMLCETGRDYINIEVTDNIDEDMWGIRKEEADCVTHV